MDPVPFLDLHAMHVEIGEELDDCWRDVRMTSRFVGGPLVGRFETEWAAYCDRRFAIGTANGTDAIELALRAHGIGDGDEVVVPANTFIATCEAVTATGAVPVFADIDPLSLLVTAETIAPVISKSTAAVIPVHLFGHCVEMGPVMDLAAANDLVVVADAAQAHGARWQGRPIGSFGHAVAFSFYPGKNLGAFGDGGAVVTDDETVAERIRSLGNHGRSTTSHTEHVVDGRNSRLDALQAAILSVKLRRLDRWNERRREVASWYRHYLDGDLALLPTRDGEEPVHHLAVVRVPGRDRIRRRLASTGIGTGIHYPVPCHRQPPFVRFARSPLPVADRMAEEILSVPMFPHMTERQVQTVAAALRDGVRVHQHAEGPAGGRSQPPP